MPRIEPGSRGRGAVPAGPLPRYTYDLPMPTTTRKDPRSDGPSRRGVLQRLALVLVGLPLLRLGETLAMAERRRSHHRGERDEIWIGHC